MVVDWLVGNEAPADERHSLTLLALDRTGLRNVCDAASVSASRRERGEGFHVAEELACAVALIVVFTGNYFLQRYYVYQAKEGDPRRQLLLYFLSSLGFRGAEYLTFLLVYNVFEVQYLVAYVGVLLVSFMIKFFYYGNLVFKGSR